MEQSAWTQTDEDRKRPADEKHDALNRKAGFAPNRELLCRQLAAGVISLLLALFVLASADRRRGHPSNAK